MKEKWMRFNSVRIGLAAGILVALCVFVITIFDYAGLFGGFSLITLIISDVYGGLGYSVSVVGGLIGAVYTLIDIFIIVWLFAVVYNWLVRKA